MTKIPFEWYDVEGAKLNVPALATTGLMIIPGCEQTKPNVLPPSVEFEGKQYRSFVIDPFGAIILGNDSVYMQKLSEDKLFPDTTSPVIIGFGEYLQVAG